MIEHDETDILILGSGGAGLFAALHAHQANPGLRITVASKGLLGKSGCTRMVQGGYNVALIPGDSVERHFMDTIEGGKWLPNQELAWTLVETAIERVRELENEIGCFFDRNPDGTLHGKAFAGQTFDRTVHKGDLTGIEIINRLMEQVWARPSIRRLEEHRAIALIPEKGHAPDATWASEGAEKDAPDATWASEGAEKDAPDAPGCGSAPEGQPGCGHPKARGDDAPDATWASEGAEKDAPDAPGCGSAPEGQPGCGHPKARGDDAPDATWASEGADKGTPVAPGCGSAPEGPPGCGQPTAPPISAVLFIDIRTGSFKLVKARAVLLATGGGPSMYKYHTPSGDKSMDGLAMALDYGLPLRDMEMVQFHPTGVLAGPDTRMTGTIIEEGLRGAGGYLLDGAKQRFMFNYDPRGERATRDLVSQSMYREMMAGRTTPNGGLYISMGHLGPDKVRRMFKGMVERCADCGFDLAGGLVEVVPTAHYLMGGVVVKADTSTDAVGLYCAGEDAGGVHGANRLGGNGVANSTVFGGIAGETMAADIRRGLGLRKPDMEAVEVAVARALAPFARKPGDVNEIRDTLLDMMWADVGIIRQRAPMQRAQAQLDALEARLSATGVPDGNRAFNLSWHDWLNLRSQLAMSKVVAGAALARENSRGSHFREDFTDAGDLATSRFTVVRKAGCGLAVSDEPVRFTHVKPGESLIKEKPRATE